MQHSPQWLDREAYPFRHQYFQTPHGSLHYVDEGQGEVIVFVHGTPTWSFLYRDYIKTFSKNYRCIAMDHLGFGLSDKPGDFEGTPQAHAQNLERLLEHLEVDSFTLVVHDFGGPIGLSYAIKYPEKVKQIILFDTWLWATAGIKSAQQVNKFLNSMIGKFLYLNTNFSPNLLMKQGFYDKKKLSKAIHKQYLKPFPNKKSRYGLFKIALSLFGASDWYESQWQQISKLEDKPFLILWGTEDKFIQKEYLKRWSQALNNKKIVEFEAGHFLMEEEKEACIQEITNYLQSQS